MRTRLLDVPLPIGGINESANYRDQPGWNPYDKVLPTAIDLRNVRVHGPDTDRARIEQREGIAKFLSAQHSGSSAIQHITHIVTSDTSSQSATSIVHRTITNVAVAGGNVKTFDSSSFSTPTGGSGALSSSAPAVFSAAMYGVLYLVDGLNYVKYTPGGSVATWTAGTGTLPTTGGKTCRLICAWAGRLVLSGLQGDGHNWFMSECFDPTNWDYGEDPSTECSPVAGNNSPAGYVDDIINALVPYNDQRLFFGGDHSIHMMDGNPMAGGRIVQVSDITGMAFGNSWCKSPDGLVWFAGSRGGLYVMSPDGIPDEVTASSLKKRLRSIDYSNTRVQLAYDWEQHAIRMYFTPLDGSASEHVFFDIRNRAALIDKFTESADYNPTAVHVFDGDDAGDRAILLGGQDGYIRTIDRDGKNDDGDPIKSYVLMGPIQNGAGNKLAIRETQIIAGENTDEDALRWQTHVAESAELAATSTKPAITGTASGGRALVDRQRAKGHAAYMKFYNDNLDETWSLERVAVGVGVLGPSEQRRIAP